MNDLFSSFMKRTLALIDEGSFFRKPFRWLYTLLAVLNLLIPIAVLVSAINNRLFRGGVFSGGGKIIVAFILVILCILSWFGFLIWWDRRDKVNASSRPDDEFVAIPVFSHFLQTCGEWLGMFVGIGGCALSLVALIFLGEEGRMLGHMLGTGSLIGGGLLSCILFPIYGFLIVVAARVLAELYRALAAIANKPLK